MWPHQRLIHLQIRRAPTQTLHVDAPFLRIQAKRVESAGLTGQLYSIDVLIAAVVARARVAFGVFVRHGGTQGVEDGAGGEVFRGDKDNGFALALDFLFL